MHRRQFLAGASAAAIGSLAGCSGSGENGTGDGSVGSWAVAADLSQADDYGVLAASPARLEASGYREVEHEGDGDVLEVTATGLVDEVFVPTYVVY